MLNPEILYWTQGFFLPERPNKALGSPS